MQNDLSDDRIAVMFLDEDQCPLFEPTVVSHQELCTDKEIDEIRSILINQGIRVINDSCLVELREGNAWISLQTGTVRLEPAVCKYCVKDCKRKSNICIIAVDSGWSNLEIGQKALLTTAKVIALSDRTLPSHVEMQIQRATLCPRFVLNTDLVDDEIPEFLQMQDKRSFTKKPLLEVASDRVKQGRLSQSAFNILRRRFTSIEKSTGK